MYARNTTGRVSTSRPGESENGILRGALLKPPADDTNGVLNTRLLSRAVLVAASREYEVNPMIRFANRYYTSRTAVALANGGSGAASDMSRVSEVARTRV